MIFLSRAVRVYVATQPTNLRQTFDGLSNQVRSVLKRDPLSGHMFVFLNRRKTQIRLLLWTRGGFTIIAKRLEGGTFAFTRAVTTEAKCVPIEAHELSLLLEGIEIQQARVSHRWEPPEHDEPI
jgi:transposase